VAVTRVGRDEVVDVAAEQGDFVGRGTQCGDAGGAIGRRNHRWRALDQAAEVGPARQAGGTGVAIEAIGDPTRQAQGELDRVEAV
jgi:hypothetical protein